jgi:phosphoribosylaminoimidazolecarboxamide formyltransferase/IMP cyclohydrolase
VHQGKALSFNNIADSDAALACLEAFGQGDPCCVIVKHLNPCGVAVGQNCEDAYDKAFACDKTSAFGGIIALNREIDEACIQRILSNQFLEILLAPSFTKDALEIAHSKPNIRIIQYHELPPSKLPLQYRQVSGGFLVQTPDQESIGAQCYRIVSQRKPSDSEWNDLLFAWTVAQFVKSNAIVYARNAMTLGIGAGQMNRVQSAQIAASSAEKAGLSLQGAVMASDAFFPFQDSVETAAAAGISAIIQPGGSIRDQEVIDCANAHNMVLVFTGVRHFRH